MGKVRGLKVSGFGGVRWMIGRHVTRVMLNEVGVLVGEKRTTGHIIGLARKE